MRVSHTQCVRVDMSGVCVCVCVCVCVRGVCVCVSPYIENSYTMYPGLLSPVGEHFLEYSTLTYCSN